MLAPLTLGAHAAMLVVRATALCGLAACVASHGHAPPPAPEPIPADTTEAAIDTTAVTPPPTAYAPPPEPPPMAPLTVDYDLSDLTMKSPRVGWATSYDRNTSVTRILRTDDAGDHFAITGPVVEAGTLCGHAFVDTDHAQVIVCTGRTDVRLVVHRTSDGGRTWSYAPIETPDDPGSPLSVASFAFRDALHGSFVTTVEDDEARAPVGLFRTNDGGRTWTEAGLVGHTYMQDVDATHAWALQGGSSSSAALLRATDGKTFQWVPELTGCTVDDLPSFFGRRGVVRATCLDTPSSFARTSDGGDHWTLGATTEPEGVFDFVDGDNGWTVGKAGIFATHDGGATWSMIDGGPRDAMGLEMLSPTVGFLQVLTDDRPVLLRTTDGGKSWRDALGLASDSVDSLDVDALDARNVFVYLHGTRGTQVYRSHDGGESFTFAATP
jgi:photosystem II stability/assembly factor-like uncharacterized protein